MHFNLEFIDSEENREIAVGYGYVSEEDLIRGPLSGVTVQGRNVYVRGGNGVILIELVK